MHNPKSPPENNSHKLFRDFQIQTDHLMSTRRPELVIVNNNNNKNKNNKKRTCRVVDFAVSADHRLKSKKRVKDNYLDFAKKGKKSVEHKNDGDTNCNCYFRFRHQRISTGTGRLRNKRAI